jgi:hypothetical protein
MYVMTKSVNSYFKDTLLLCGQLAPMDFHAPLRNTGHPLKRTIIILPVVRSEMKRRLLMMRKPWTNEGPIRREWLPAIIVPKFTPIDSLVLQTVVEADVSETYYGWEYLMSIPKVLRLPPTYPKWRNQESRLGCSSNSTRSMHPQITPCTPAGSKQT